jgi:CheY-like chemotaxis protein
MNPTIAVIDDDDGVRMSLSSLVRSLGYEVRTYGSAVAFLEDAGSGAVDCIITDLQMPQMSGEQLQAQLVSSGRTLPTWGSIRRSSRRRSTCTSRPGRRPRTVRPRASPWSRR